MASKKQKELEKLERDYLERIYFILYQDLGKMIDGLNSKDKIKKDWVDKFKRLDKKRQNSDFARGAERIYFWLFNQFGKPNSSPIGADMFFEEYNAFIHIDIKTAKLNNPADYKGRVPISENQTSYNSTSGKFRFTTNLPHYYSFQSKPCLTYVINIIYDDANDDFKIRAIFLICIPNGKLFSVYGDGIINKGKNKGRSFRYNYSVPHFETMPGKPNRIKTLYLDAKLNKNAEDFLTYKSTSKK